MKHRRHKRLSKGCALKIAPHTPLSPFPIFVSNPPSCCVRVLLYLYVVLRFVLVGSVHLYTSSEHAANATAAQHRYMHARVAAGRSLP